MKRFKLFSKVHWLLKFNLIFVFVFLNVWDFITSGQFINAMILGIVIFGFPALLWFWGNFKAVMAATLISIFEFVVLSVFVLQSFELGGVETGINKSFFWFPYLFLAGLNAFWGLRIYSKNKKQVELELGESK